MMEPLHNEYQTDLKIHNYTSLALTVMTLILLLIATVGFVRNPDSLPDYLIYLTLILFGGGILLYNWILESGTPIREVPSQFISNKKNWHSIIIYSIGVVGVIAIITIYYIIADNQAMFDLQTFLTTYYSLFLLVYITVVVLFVITGRMVWKEIRIKSRGEEKELYIIYELAQRISQKSKSHEFDTVFNVLKTLYYNSGKTWENIMNISGEDVPESTFSTWKKKLNTKIKEREKWTDPPSTSHR